MIDRRMRDDKMMWNMWKYARQYAIRSSNFPIARVRNFLSRAAQSFRSKSAHLESNLGWSTMTVVVDLVTLDASVGALPLQILSSRLFRYTEGLLWRVWVSHTRTPWLVVSRRSRQMLLASDATMVEMRLFFESRCSADPVALRLQQLPRCCSYLC
jgi:hypothetical protein